MYLAEAIMEEDYLREAINNLSSFIRCMLFVSDKSEYRLQTALIDGKIGELKELYKKLQQFAITTKRAKANTMIKVNDTELSLLDACVIKDEMFGKLENFELFLSTGLNERNNNRFICLDLETIQEEIETLRLDIKSLESQIDNALWQVEV